jgi:hypothetical protein
MKKKKKKLVGQVGVQASQASVQNKFTGKRGTRVTAGRVTCSDVARNGDSKQEGACPQQRQQQQMPPVTSASGMEKSI